MSLLKVENLRTWLENNGQIFRAVDGVSFELEKGETFSLLGESGCGKSMTSLSILRLIPDTGKIVGGDISFGGVDLLALPERIMRDYRGRKIGIIFQEPGLSLNPVLTIGAQVDEVLERHTSLDARARKSRIVELLDQVGIPDPSARMEDYPFQLSGGMKQRAMIAMTLAAEPEILIADEPTTALDVTIQAQILDLLRSLQKRLGMSVLLITHDLGVVSEMANRVAVMYAGEIVETATRDSFFSSPAHPYSRKLFASLPGRAKRGKMLDVIRGAVPSLSSEFRGCRFADRCDHAFDLCRAVSPGWYDSGTSLVRCHLYAQGKFEFPDKQPESPARRSAPEGAPLLEVAGLKVHFPVRKGIFGRIRGQVRAVDGISFSISGGRTLALVGESGCGKTTTGKAVLQLIRPTSGSVHYKGTELSALEGQSLKKAREGLQIVFQDPYASLNPRMRIREIMMEGGADAGRIVTLLEEVGLSGDAQFRYPHEFSGGQRQRVAIARVLAANPKLIVCDEPTSALDVSVQAQILNLLGRLQTDLGLSYLFITHNIAVVEYLAHEVAVMYMGRIVEKGKTEQIMDAPAHPYTRALLASVPSIERKSPQAFSRFDMPSPIEPHRGCPYHLRCAAKMPECEKTYPGAAKLNDTHEVHCHLYGDGSVPRE